MTRMPILGWILIAAPLVLSCAPRDKLSAVEIQAIETTLENYRRAWLSGDSAAVLEVLSEDIMLFVPGTTATTVVSKSKVREFWFPPTDISYPITRYEISDQQIHGSGIFAVAHGRSNLSWNTVAGDSLVDSSTVASEFMSVLRKEDGKWRIFRQMYVVRS